MSDEERRARAEARSRSMTVRKATIDDATDPSPVFGTEAISLLTQLTRTSWALAAGDADAEAVPRDRMHVRFVRRAHRS